MSEWTAQDYEDGTKVRCRLGANELHVDFEFLGEDGEMEIEGSVKWDGCMNWATNEDCMFHFCSTWDAERLASKFKAVWAMAEGMVPKADFGPNP